MGKRECHRIWEDMYEGICMRGSHRMGGGYVSKEEVCDMRGAA